MRGGTQKTREQGKEEGNQAFKDCLFIHVPWQNVENCALSALGNSPELFKSDLDKRQSLFSIRGWSSALNCNAILVPLPPLLFLFWAFWSSAQHFQYLPLTRWFEIRVFTKVLGLSKPACSPHCWALKQIIRNDGRAAPHLKSQFAQITWKGMPFWTGGWPESSCKLTF